VAIASVGLFLRSKSAAVPAPEAAPFPAA